ncbi:MAG: HPr family phosphocarrier protein [Kiritimatiellae bacterium]|nr:HPr family phosphocarrier protein [Kiritimatiellia bacterium]
MVEREATVRNEMGIHCRPSTVIVKEMKDHLDHDIVVEGEMGTTDARSVVGLVALELLQGRRVTIRVSGPREKKLCRRLVELFETNFDFPPREEAAGCADP